MIVLAALYTSGFIILLTYAWIHEEFPIYTKNKGKFYNFTIADFILFIPLIPAAILIVPFLGEGKIGKLFNYRPFKKAILKVGDKVNDNGTIREILEVALNSEIEEVVRLSGYKKYDLGCWQRSKDLKKVSPLEELL